MVCESCGEKPKDTAKDFTKAVIEIDNPEQITLMRRVVIPASMGDDTAVPPVVGKYHNVLLYYEANQKSYLYSSDGIPTLLANGITDYEQAVNLPQINGITLLGDKSSTDLGLQPTLSVTPDTGIKLENNELSGLPATASTIGMIKPGAGLEVATDGTISISDIEQYAHFFDTVADMKAATNLVAGDYARTGGFHTVNDGGGALYKITNTGTANEMDVIAVGNLYANFVNPLVVSPEMLGAYGDGTHDDTTYIQYALDNFDTVKLCNKSYLAKGVRLVSFKTLIGDGENTKLIGDDTTDGFIIYTDDNSDIERLNIRNITLTNYVIGINAIGVKYSQFHNIKTDYCNLGARFAGKTFANKLYNCEFRHSTTDGFECGLPVTHPILNTTITPNIATFDFYSCAFHVNGGYGINGWMRVFNFYGGYSENNTSGAVKMVSTSSNFSTQNSFFGLDIEDEFIAYRFETSDNSDCNFSYINIVGGQIALRSQTNNELRAVLYFKGNRCRWDSVHNINVQARHTTTTTDNNTYDIYADVTTGLASSSLMCSYNSASSQYTILKTNVYSLKPCNIFKVTEDLPLGMVNNYFNINNSKIELPAGESFKITIPNLAYIENVKVTSDAAASLKLYAYGQNIDIYKQTGSTPTTASDSDNVTTLNIGTNADSFVIRNMDSSNAVTITNLHLDGFIGR